jgi:hypothetical protein
LRAIDRLIRDEDPAAGFSGRGVDLPAGAEVERQRAADLPLVLQVEVVLLDAVAEVPQVHAVAALERHEGVGGEIAEKSLREAGRNAQEVVDRALQPVEVGGVDPRGGRGPLRRECESRRRAE